MSLSAVENLLNRLSISDVIPAFKAAGIEKLLQLRSMPEDKLKELVPNDEARAKLLEAITRNSEPSRVGPASVAHQGPPPVYGEQGEARQGQRICKFFRTPQGCKKGSQCNLLHVDGPPIPSVDRPPRPHVRRVCRDFFEPGGCKYGAECKFSHDQADKDAAASGRDRMEGGDFYSEEISVPSDSVKYLLANKADKLNKINTMCGTTNSRIEKPDGYMQFFTITLKGSKEGVAKARTEIERYVGITSAQNKEARFQYVNHELERNVQACQMLCAANIRNKGTNMEISEKTLRAVIETFRFQPPPQLQHFWILSSHIDKEKFEVVEKVLKSMECVQCILFTEPNRVVEMQKRASQTSHAFGVKNPQFVHRGLSKEERMKALEAFKEGELNEKGQRQRLLVTNNDYAKLARKIVIPYCNFVVHFAIPKTKEIYTMQSQCCGRHGHPGISLLFITNNDAAIQKEWSDALTLEEFSGEKWDAACTPLQYDKTDAPLNPKDAEPPANWKELLEVEKAEKAEKKKE